MKEHFTTDDLSVEDIIEQRKRGASAQSGRQWSMEDIDALLADEPAHGKAAAATVAEETPSVFHTQELPVQEETPRHWIRAVQPVQEEAVDHSPRKIIPRAERVEQNKGVVAPKQYPRAPLRSVEGIEQEYARKIRPAREHPAAVEQAAQPTTGDDLVRTKYYTLPVEPEVQVHQAKKPARHERAVESPGFIKKRSKFSATADLEPLPTIMAADAGLEKKIKKAAIPAVPEDNIEGQMFFSDFLEEEPAPEQIDEQAAEYALRSKRKEKIRGFQLTEVFRDVAREEQEGPVYTQEQAPNSTQAEPEAYETDYHDRRDAGDIRQQLQKRQRANTAWTVLTLLLGIGTSVLAIAEQIRFTSGEGVAFPGGMTGFLTWNVCALVLAGVMGGSVMLRGIKELFRLRPNADSPIVLAMLAALAQVCVLFAVPDASALRMSVFAGAAVLVLAMNLLGKNLMLGRVIRNFDFCTSGDALFAIHSIENGSDADEIGRGLLMGEPDIKYSARVLFPKRFLELSFKDDPADRVGRIATLFLLVGCTAAAIAGGLAGHSVAMAFSAMAATACVGVPAAALIVSNLPLLRAARRLTPEGAMLSGYAAVHGCAHTNAVVFDSSDIFARGGCNIHGIKTYHNMRIDEAILHTATLVIHSGGPCGEIFDRVIEGKRDLLPPVEDLKYEDRLGISAWVQGRRVLVGNREMLVHHNIEAPSRESERKYKHDGRQVMYLAVSGKLSAMFVVSYGVNEDIAERLQRLNGSGMTILVRTTDANITEELIEDYFELEPNSVKIMSSKAASVYRTYHDTPKKEAAASLLHDGKLNSFLLAVSAAFDMNAGIGLTGLVQKIASVVGMVIVLVFACLASAAQAGIWQVLIYQALWGIVCVLLSIRQRI